jgi:hypothetical protein
MAHIFSTYAAIRAELTARGLEGALARLSEAVAIEARPLASCQADHADAIEVAGHVLASAVGYYSTYPGPLTAEIVLRDRHAAVAWAVAEVLRAAR